MMLVGFLPPERLFTTVEISIQLSTNGGFNDAKNGLAAGAADHAD